jgi:hypothetical protein
VIRGAPDREQAKRQIERGGGRAKFPVGMLLPFGALLLAISTEEAEARAADLLPSLGAIGRTRHRP